VDLNQLNQSNKLNKSNQIFRLVLGTAQLGINYGIANRTGQPNLKTAEQIIQTAWENGIREFDTAQGYGESERVLGNVIQSLGLNDEARIITKFHPDLDYLDKTALEKSIKKSLTNLNVPTLYGLMLHREEYLGLWEKGLGDTLKGFITKGLTEHIGVSVYSPDKAVLALETAGINIVQLPSNIFDRRFEKAGVFELAEKFPSNIFDRRFEKAGVFELAEKLQKDIYVRSVYLQGLLFLKPNELPNHMYLAEPVLKNLEAFLKENGYTYNSLALSYVKQAYPKAKILMGAETPEQVEENIKVWGATQSGDVVDRVRLAFPSVDEKILNPSFWKQL
jgi:aryl-alcohol dehydrogenase-like predicted oxidoreductase